MFRFLSRLPKFIDLIMVYMVGVFVRYIRKSPANEYEETMFTGLDSLREKARARLERVELKRLPS